MKVKFISLLLSTVVMVTACDATSPQRSLTVKSADTHTATAVAVTERPTAVPTQKSVEPTVEPSSVLENTTYILNTNTHKFHFASCSSIRQIKDKNKREITGSRDEAIAQGYSPCAICNP